MTLKLKGNFREINLDKNCNDNTEKLEFVKEFNNIKATIITNKTITLEDEKILKDLIMKCFVNNPKYDVDMIEYYESQINYITKNKTISVHNVEYKFYWLNMTSKKAIIKFTY